MLAEGKKKKDQGLTDGGGKNLAVGSLLYMPLHKCHLGWHPCEASEESTDNRLLPSSHHRE